MSSILGQKINDYNYRWYKLLTPTIEDKIDFIDLYIKHGLMLAIAKKRQVNINEGIGQNVTVEDLKDKCYIEQLFQEPIYIDTILEVMNDLNWTWEDILEEHKKYPYKRILRILNCKR